MDGDRGAALTRRQLSALLFTAMVSPLVRQVPGAAGRGAWLAGLLALPLVFAAGRAAERLLDRRSPGEGPGGLLCRQAGLRVGRAVSGLFGLWFLFYGGFVLRAGADRFVSAVYTDSPVWIFLAVMGLLALPAGLGRLRTLGRFAEIAAVPVAAVFALVIPFSAELLDVGELWPLSAEDLRAAALGAVPFANALSSALCLTLFVGKSEKTPLRRTFSVPMAALALLGALLGAITVGSFGAGLAGKMNYPFFVLLRNLRVFRLLDRAEALVVAQWAVTDFLLLSALLRLAAAALALSLFGPGQTPGRALTLGCAAATLLIGLLCAPTAFALRRLGETVIPKVHAALVFIVLPLCLIPDRRRNPGSAD